MRALVDELAAQNETLVKFSDVVRDIAQRLIEAQDRGLWTPRLNSTRDVLQRLGRAEAV